MPGPGSYHLKSKWEANNGSSIFKSSSMPNLKVRKEISKSPTNLQSDIFDQHDDELDENSLEGVKFDNKDRYTGINEDTVGPGRYDILKLPSKGRSTNWNASKTVRELPYLKSLQRLDEGSFFITFF